MRESTVTEFVRVMVYLKLALTAAIWGATFIAGRVAVQSMHPFAIAFFRFAIASLCLLFLIRPLSGGLPRLNLQQTLLILLMGLTGIFTYNACFFIGLKTIAASRAALIVALNPVATTLSSALIFKDKLTPLKLLGILISLLGASIVIAKGNPLTLLIKPIETGDIFLLGCVISWVIYTLISKVVMKELSPLVTTTYACLMGSAALFFAAWGEGVVQNLSHASALAWLSILYLGIFGSAIGFNWYGEGVREIGPAKASVFINLVPVSAIIFAALFLHEPLTPVLLGGGALVITGVFFTTSDA